jgi:hypothetical protein
VRGNFEMGLADEFDEPLNDGTAAEAESEETL